MVFVCGAAAGMVAIATVANCLGQTGDSSPPGTKVSAVCTPAVGTAYYSLLAAAAAIAFIGVATGHIRNSRRAATISTWISLGLIAVCVISGFAIKATPRTSYSASLNAGQGHGPNLRVYCGARPGCVTTTRRAVLKPA